MVKHDWQLVLANKSFVEHVEHFEERRFVADLGHDVFLEVTLCGRTGLSPNFEFEILEMVAHL